MGPLYGGNCPARAGPTHRDPAPLAPDPQDWDPLDPPPPPPQQLTDQRAPSALGRRRRRRPKVSFGAPKVEGAHRGRGGRFPAQFCWWESHTDYEIKNFESRAGA